MKQESRIERRVMFFTRRSISVVDSAQVQPPDGDGWVFGSVECKVKTVAKPEREWNSSSHEHYVTIISHWWREVPSP